MVAWVWVALAGLAVVSLQAYLFHRARQNWGADGEQRQRRRGYTDASNVGESADTEHAGVRCPHCGQPNGADFTFCRRCVQRLR